MIQVRQQPDEDSTSKLEVVTVRRDSEEVFEEK